MREMEFALNNSSQKLLSLAKTLNAQFEDKVLDSLLVKRTKTRKAKSNKINSKFASHPERISSGSELSVVKSVNNGFCKNMAPFNYMNFLNNINKNITPSESSVSINSDDIPGSKCAIKSPVLSCYSDTQTNLIKQLELAAENKKRIKSNTLFNSKNEKSKKNVALLRSEINSKPALNYVKPTIPQIITSTARNLIPKNIDEKLRTIMEKTSSCLDDIIRVTLNDEIHLPDGIDEWERTKKRTFEFVARFGRNYVYPLERNIAQLEKHTQCFNKIAIQTVMNIHQLLLMAHQSVLNVFQAYRTNMVTCISSFLVEKLKQVLNKSILLCNIHSKCLNLEQIGNSKPETLIDDLETRCRSVLTIVQQFRDQSMSFQEMKIKLESRTRLSLKGCYHLRRKDTKRRRIRKIDSKLSMYSAPPGCKPRKGSVWIKNVDHVSKKKYKYGNVQSRYLTAGYKHRPPFVHQTQDNNKPPFISVPLRTKCFHKKNGYWKNTPLPTERNEDEIQTVVEIQTEKSKITEIESLNHKQYSKINLKESSSSCGKTCINEISYKNIEEQSENDKKLQDLSPIIHETCQQVVTAENETTVSQKHLEGLVKDLLGMALNEKINGDRESGSNKNGFVDRNNSFQSPKNNNNNKKEYKDSKFNDRQMDQILDNDESIIEESCKNNNKSTRSDDGLREKRKMLNKNCKIITSVGIIKEQPDHESSVKKQGEDSLLEYVEFDNDDKCKKMNFDGNFIKRNKTNVNQANKFRGRQVITVTGAKNAQLICIKNEDTVLDGYNSNKKLKAKQIKFDKNDNAICVKNKGNKTMDVSRKVNSKINKLPKKTLKQLILIPKKEALNVIQYKLQYIQFVKGNAMYTKSSTVQPWMIVNSLSEQLLNNLLLSIAKEIQVEDILQNLYESEFQ